MARVLKKKVASLWMGVRLLEKHGAYITCACHPDLEVARRLLQGGLTVHARFGVMHDKTSGPLSDHQKQVLQDLHNAYDMRQHTHGDSAQAAVLTPECIDQFAAGGCA